MGKEELDAQIANQIAWQTARDEATRDEFIRTCATTLLAGELSAGYGVNEDDVKRAVATARAVWDAAPKTL